MACVTLRDLHDQPRSRMVADQCVYYVCTTVCMHNYSTRLTPPRPSIYRSRCADSIHGKCLQLRQGWLSHAPWRQGMRQCVATKHIRFMNKQVWRIISTVARCEKTLLTQSFDPRLMTLRTYVCGEQAIACELHHACGHHGCARLVHHRIALLNTTRGERWL